MDFAMLLTWINLALLAGFSYAQDVEVTPSRTPSRVQNRGKPVNEISCETKLPPWPLPSPYNKVGYLLLSEICGSDENGGDWEGNLGGSCIVASTTGVPRLVFQINTYSELFRHRPTRLWCLVHCQCKNYPRKYTWKMINGRSYFTFLEARGQWFDLSNGGFVVVDELQDSPYPLETIVPPHPPGLSESDSGYEASSSASSSGHSASSHVFKTINPKEIIFCSGYLPWWPLPGNIPVSTYATLQDICASVKSYGSSEGNAGGTCSNDPKNMVPIFKRENAIGMLWEDEALKAYCAVHCWCLQLGIPEDNQRRRGPIVQIGPEQYVDTTNWGLVEIFGQPDNPTSTRVLSPQRTAPPYTPNEEGYPSDDERVQAARLLMVGSRRPPQRPRLDDAVSQSSESQASGQCRARCNSARDCLMAGAMCICMAYLAYLSIDNFIATCSLHKRGRRDLNDGTACPCNSTYVSHSCCGVSDGLVWEGPEMKLGKLIVDSDGQNLKI